MTMQEIYRSVITFDKNKVVDLVKKELNSGTQVTAILKEGLIAPLDEVGQRFSRGEMFLPEMLAAAQAMKAGVEVLRPLLTSAETKPAGTVVIGTVKDDLHDIGKNLVAMMLEGAGFRVIDLGTNVDYDRFVEGAKANQADIVALSALLTTTMPAMKTTVAKVREAGAASKIIVGGAPVNQSFSDQIGADGYSDDAPGAVVLARKLLGIKTSR
jgi:5-methyltetrahydrofolate--homocysteine methyltransferase